MTTDAGIDLVVYAPNAERALTVQVKTCLKPKPAGGKLDFEFVSRVNRRMRITS